MLNNFELPTPEVHCPYCGHNVLGESEGDPCEHLLADWTADPGDNSGGILGWALVGGSLPVRPLALAIQTLHAELLAPNQAQFEPKIEVLRQLLPSSEKPIWWPALCAALDDQGNDPIPNKDYDLGRIPTQLALDILDLPEICLTTENLTSVPFISTDNTFVWAKDDTVAAKAIQQCLDEAVKIVHRATELHHALSFPVPDDQNLHRLPAPFSREPNL